MIGDTANNITTDEHNALVWPGLLYVHRRRAIVCVLCVEDSDMTVEQGLSLAQKVIDADIARIPEITPWKRLKANQVEAELRTWEVKP